MYLAEGKKVTKQYKGNMNMLVVGGPGTGKSRHHVLPGLLGGEFSAVVLDPKGEMWDMSSGLMRERGYNVLCIDFKDPQNTEMFYNPLHHIRKDCHMSEDIISLTKVLVEQQEQGFQDPFWNRAAQLLANALIGYLIEECREEEQTFESMITLIKNMMGEGVSVMDVLMNELREKHPTSFAVEQYDLFKTVGASEKTFVSIIISLVTMFAESLSEGMKHLTSKNTLDFKMLADERTVLYIKSSDTDRSKDVFVSMLFMQLFHELYTYADEQEDHCLKEHVHFFIDDLGTNLRLDSLDVYIAANRSREISFSVILQSEGQLKKLYGESWATIVGSCEYYLFLGTNDLASCKSVSERLNRPLEEILYKKREEIFLFQQNKPPFKGRLYDITKDENFKFVKEL